MTVESLPTSQLGRIASIKMDNLSKISLTECKKRNLGLLVKLTLTFICQHKLPFIVARQKMEGGN